MGCDVVVVLLVVLQQSLADSMPHPLAPASPGAILILFCDRKRDNAVARIAGCPLPDADFYNTKSTEDWESTPTFSANPVGRVA